MKKIYYLLLLFTLQLGALSLVEKSKKRALPVAKKIKDMNKEEVTYAHNYYEIKNSSDLAIESLERMHALSTDNKELEQLLLKLADSYFKVEKYQEAQKKYTDYVSLYPGSSHTKRALYQEQLSAFKQMPSKYSDQTITEHIISSGNAFLSTYPQDTEYSIEVKRMKQEAYKNLVAHEENICEHYLKKDVWSQRKGHIKAAENRIAHIKEAYLPHLEQAEETIKSLELKLAQLDTLKNPIVSKKNTWFLF